MGNLKDPQVVRLEMRRVEGQSQDPCLGEALVWLCCVLFFFVCEGGSGEGREVEGFEGAAELRKMEADLEVASGRTTTGWVLE